MGIIEGAISRGQAERSRGLDLYVDTVSGTTGGDGRSWESAKSTMAAALALATDHSQVNVVGDVREQLVAPLGIQGVKIVGAAGGRPRHDDGVRWRQAAVAGNAPLIDIREQGWEFHNILFVPQPGYAAIRCHRAEDATYPDGSHFIVKGCKFIGSGIDVGGVGVGYGIQDFGGMHHALIEDNEFSELEYAIWSGGAGNPGIAAPLRITVRNNIFEDNVNDIYTNANRWRILDNYFLSPYVVVTHPNTVNLAATQDVSGRNRVAGNHFADAAADVTIAKGYKPSTGDVWRNFGTGAADAIIAVPA